MRYDNKYIVFKRITVGNAWKLWLECDNSKEVLIAINDSKCSPDDFKIMAGDVCQYHHHTDLNETFYLEGDMAGVIIKYDRASLYPNYGRCPKCEYCGYFHDAEEK